MGLFDTLRALREFEKEHFPFVRTLEDHDILREIGFHQEAERPLTLKQLFLAGIGSVATVQRRLARLKALGVVQQRRVQHDRRAYELLLSPKVLKAYAQYRALLRPYTGPRRRD